MLLIHPWNTASNYHITNAYLFNVERVFRSDFNTHKNSKCKWTHRTENIFFGLLFRGGRIFSLPPDKSDLPCNCKLDLKIKFISKFYKIWIIIAKTVWNFAGVCHSWSSRLNIFVFRVSWSPKIPWSNGTTFLCNMVAAKVHWIWWHWL